MSEVVKIVFTDLAALEKELKENISNGAISFQSEKELPPRTVITIELFFASSLLAKFEAAVSFGSKGFFAATILDFDQSLFLKIEKAFKDLGPEGAAEKEEDKSASDKPETAKVATPGAGVAADDLFSQASAENFAPRAEPQRQSAAEPVPEEPAEQATVEGKKEAPAAAKEGEEEEAPLGQGVLGEIAHSAEMELDFDTEKIAKALVGGQQIKLAFFQLYLTIYTEQLSGLLRVQLSDRIKEFTFVAGIVVSSSIKKKIREEYLPMVLFNEKLITQEQYKAANTEKKNSNKRLGEILIEHGALSEQQLDTGLELQTTVFFNDIFAAEKATYEWIAVDYALQDIEPMKAKPLGIAYRGLKTTFKTFFHFTELLKILEEYRNTYPMLKDDLKKEDYQLNDREEKIWTTVINGHRNLREVFESSTYGRPDTSRILVTFKILNILEFLKNPLSDLAARGEELIRFVETLETANYFDLLHIHWASPDYYYERAYKKEMARLGTSGEFAKAAGKVKEALSKLRKKVEEVGRVLLDKDKRVAYRLDVYGQRKCQFISEMKSKKGGLALYKGELQEAYDCFISAIELNSKNNEARSGLSETRKRGGGPPKSS